jgi:hypothetical protein
MGNGLERSGCRQAEETSVHLTSVLYAGTVLQMVLTESKAGTTAIRTALVNTFTL